MHDSLHHRREDQARSLDVQIEHWNSNESVKAAASEIIAAVREASDRFAGPQATPPAPWHYTYVPDAAPAD